MVTIEQINSVDPQAADWAATLLDSVDCYDPQSRSTLASDGMRGLCVGRLDEATGKADKGEQTADRHVFIEGVFGIQGGSCKTMSDAQCHATVAWLGDGGAKHIPRIVQAVLKATGQMALDGIDVDPVVQAGIELGAEVRSIEPGSNSHSGRSNTMSNATHWSQNGDTERKFWEFVTALGLTPADVYKKLGENRLQDAPADKAAVVEMVKGAVSEKQAEIRKELKPQEALHGEARAIAWADVFLPDGTMVNLTARHGATVDDVVSNALVFADAWERLQVFGWSQVPKRVGRRTPGNGNGNGHSGSNGHDFQPHTPAQITTQPEQPTALAPTTIAPTTPPPANGRSYIDCDEIRVGLTKAQNPCVQFWITSQKRDYPELRYHHGGAKLLEIAPWLNGLDQIDKDGKPYKVDVARLDMPTVAGNEIRVRCRVYYADSENKNSKGVPYKNVVGVDRL